jgi:hypothetical protein
VRNGLIPALGALVVLGAILQLCTMSPVAAEIYKCVGRDGSTSYSDTRCDSNAKQVTIQTTPTSVPTGPEVLSAFYVSPRTARALDVTYPLKSLCLNAPGSCVVRCGNQLGGDPDFGRRKYCQVTFRCAGGGAQQLRILEGDIMEMNCPRPDVAAALKAAPAAPPPPSHAADNSKP